MIPPVSIRRVIVLAVAAVAASVQSADAHVLIRPDRAPTETLTLFTVLSPDEKQIPLTGLRLTIPPSLVVSSVADTAGYRTQIVRDQNFRTVAIAWTGGRTAPTHLALFQFAALTPTRPTSVRLSGLQTFSDGSTKLWPKVSISVARAPAAAGSDTTTTRTEVFAALAVAAIALIGSGMALAIALRRRSVRPGDGDRSGRPPSAPGAGASADRR